MQKLIEFIATIEAMDVLMATLREYDALWDGVLLPEIIDAEIYDTPVLTTYVRMPGRFAITELKSIIDQSDDRAKAMKALMATVGELGARYMDEPFIDINIDGSRWDCPVESQK